MSTFDLLSVLVTLTAALAYLNRRYLKLPGTIGVTLVGLGVSALLLGLVALHVPVAVSARGLLEDIKFNDVVFQGLLSFLLFAGALKVNGAELARQRGAVLTFALASTAISIAAVGGLLYLAAHALGFGITFAQALLFGAIISPTDPVAVLDLLKRAKVGRRLETLIAGESLFNDGIGVVAFTAIVALVQGDGERTSVVAIGELLLREALGGIVFGWLLGFAVYKLLKPIDDYVVEVLVTLALVTGGYALALTLGVSGPLAMVSAGLTTGRLTRRAFSDLTREHFDGFWDLLDELLNVALFVLIGLEVIVVNFAPGTVALGLLSIVIVLLARLVSVQLPLRWLTRFYTFSPFTSQVMIWGGLRGGIAVALAFSVPAGAQRSLLLTLTYVVVVFSIVVQGLSMNRLAARAARAAGPEEGEQVPA